MKKEPLKNNVSDYVIRVFDSPLEVDANAWSDLLALQNPAGTLNPFMRHEYLAAMHASGSASPETGWSPRFVALFAGEKLTAACALYLKVHSYGEYVLTGPGPTLTSNTACPITQKQLSPPPSRQCLARACWLATQPHA